MGEISEARNETFEFEEPLDEEEILMIYLWRRNQRRKERKRRFWVRQIYQQRKQKGEYHLLVKDLKLFDDELFFTYFRMSTTKFEGLLSWVAPHITKSSMKREAVGPSERLCVALRYLATGDAQSTIALSYRLSPTTVTRILYETLPVIWTVLNENDYMKFPSCHQDFF